MFGGRGGVCNSINNPMNKPVGPVLFEDMMINRSIIDYASQNSTTPAGAMATAEIISPNPCENKLYLCTIFRLIIYINHMHMQIPFI